MRGPVMGRSSQHHIGKNINSGRVIVRTRSPPSNSMLLRKHDWTCRCALCVGEFPMRTSVVGEKIRSSVSTTVTVAIPPAATAKSSRTNPRWLCIISLICCGTPGGKAVKTGGTRAVLLLKAGTVRRFPPRTTDGRTGTWTGGAKNGIVRQRRRQCFGRPCGAPRRPSRRDVGELRARRRRKRQSPTLPAGGGRGGKTLKIIRRKQDLLPLSAGRSLLLTLKQKDQKLERILGKTISWAAVCHHRSGRSCRRRYRVRRLRFRVVAEDLIVIHHGQIPPRSKARGSNFLLPAAMCKFLQEGWRHIMSLPPSCRNLPRSWRPER